MKHVLAAATVATLLAAAPAGAQVAYGMTPGETATAGFAPTANWRNAIVIYAESPESILLDRLTAPLGDDVAGTSAGTVGGVTFDIRGTSGTASLAGIGGTTDATNPVPEPATWAMMLVGFAAVGGALRSRRNATLRYA